MTPEVSLEPFPASDSPPRRIALWRAAAVLGLAAVLLGLCLVTGSPHASTVAGVRLTLPYRLGDWWGTDGAISAAEKIILPSDTEFARKNYISSRGDEVLCSIVLSGAEKRSIHRPEECLPGQGWTIQSSEAIPIILHSGRTLNVMKLGITRPVILSNGQRRDIQAYYLYWFVGEDVTTPYHWKRVWLTSWDRIVHHLNHRWAYVIVNSLVTAGLKPEGKNAQETLEMLKQFTADVVPAFQIDEMPPAAPAS